MSQPWADVGPDTPGGRLQVDYRASDRWLIGAEADFASYATPLRADRADISSDRYSVRARYRRSEWWDLGGELAYQPFDDGNDVTSASLYGSYRLINGYTYKLDLYGSTGLANSTLDDPVYFSPESAFALTGGVRNTWRQFRRYQHMLTHRLSADIGLYDQKGFSGAPTWTLDYELEWQLSSRLALRGGAQQAAMVGRFLKQAVGQFQAEGKRLADQLDVVVIGKGRPAPGEHVANSLDGDVPGRTTGRRHRHRQE